MNSETNKEKSCFVYKDNKLREFYRKKNGNVCFRCTVKTCKARIETNAAVRLQYTQLSLNMETMITLTKLAMLQLLRYEFPANVQLRSFQYALYTSSQYIENTHFRFSCGKIRVICCLYIQNSSFLY